MEKKDNNTVVEIPIDESIPDRLLELSLENPLLFSRFVKYCYAPHIMKLDRDSLEILIEKGFVRTNYSIPTDVRTVVLHSTALF